MKISVNQTLPASTTDTNYSTKAQVLAPDSDLLRKKKHTRRQARTPKFSTRIGKNGALNGNKSRSRPETPLLRWKFDEKVKAGNRDRDGDEGECVKSAAESGGRKEKMEREVAREVSVRKLAAVLWRLQVPEMVTGVRDVKKSGDRLESQPGVSHVGVPFVCHRKSIKTVSESEDLGRSPRSVSGPKNGFLSKLEPSFQFTNTAMEGATKWNPVGSKTVADVRNFYSYMKPIEQQVSAVSLVTALETELEQARGRIQDLETERKSSKRKIEHFLKKLSEEKSEWRRREHEKVRAIIEDFKADLNRERKNRQRVEIINSKLVNELTEVKLSAKRYIQDFEKERKDRELIEEVCDELAKEIGENKELVEALKRESLKLREEVEEERKMLQMAEVWREERVQMKLVDAKITLEETFLQMKKLVEDLETFLMSKSAPLDVKEMRQAEMLQQAADSINIHEITEFSYEPPNPDDIFSVFEDVNFGELPEQEIGPPLSHASKIHTASPEVNMYSKDLNQRHVHAYLDDEGDLEEDASGWETVSQLEDQESSYSPNGSAPSVNNKIHRDSNVSGSGTDWEEDNAGKGTPVTEICLVQSRQMKKSSSISRLWKSSYPNNGEKTFKIISVDGINGNVRLSNGTTHSSDLGSGKGGLSPRDMVEQWSSPESGNPHTNKGMKGCIEWPRGAPRNSLKARLMEARIESQKPQLRQVLKQKM